MNLHEIKSHFANVDEYLSKESWVMDPYISSLEDMEYLGCEDELADLQADSVSNKYFQENRYKIFWIVKGHTVAPRLAKHAVTRVILVLVLDSLQRPCNNKNKGP